MDIYDNYDEEYIQGLKDFLTFEEGETVLEIAGGRGHYHSFYNKFKIGKYIAVEPNFEWLESTKSREYDCITEFNNCIYEDYYPTETIDTLICAGLMYHLPHPTHFLEVVRNRFKPKTLYLETVGAYPEKNVHDVLEAHFTPEIVNTYGQRFDTPSEGIYGNGFNAEYKSVGISLKPSLEFYIYCLSQLGYKLEKYKHISIDDEEIKSKQDVTMFKYRLG